VPQVNHRYSRQVTRKLGMTRGGLLALGERRRLAISSSRLLDPRLLDSSLAV
jgi:hypothetical protein